VADLDAAAFQELAEYADRECPISNAVRGNVEVRVTATLEER
jgi:organic hydroperoxide reductase OsmC/OhrA